MSRKLCFSWSHYSLDSFGLLMWSEWPFLFQHAEIRKVDPGGGARAIIETQNLSYKLRKPIIITPDLISMLRWLIIYYSPGFFSKSSEYTQQMIWLLHNHLCSYSALYRGSILLFLLVYSRLFHYTLQSTFILSSMIFSSILFPVADVLTYWLLGLLLIISSFASSSNGVFSFFFFFTYEYSFLFFGWPPWKIIDFSVTQFRQALLFRIVVLMKGCNGLGLFCDQPQMSACSQIRMDILGGPINLLFDESNVWPQSNKLHIVSLSRLFDFIKTGSPTVPQKRTLLLIIINNWIS